MKEPRSRAALRNARRVLVKAGTSVVANEDGRPSLTRLGAIAEQIAELNRNGVEVIFVSSGAVGMGKRLLRKQGQMKMTFQELQSDRDRSGSIGEGPPMRRNSSFAALVSLDERPHTLRERKNF